MPTDVALVHNPKAGSESFTEKKLVRLLRSFGYRPRYLSRKDALGGGNALDHGDFVVVAGGDGSIRKIALELAGTKRALAPLPLGTANNIARSLGLDPSAPEKIVAGWAQPVRRKLDIGIARGPWGKKYFIEGLGLGLIGRAIAIVEDIDANSGRAFSTRDDKLHRDMCVMIALAHEMPPTEVQLTLGGEKRTDRFLLLEILNIDRAGPGIELASEADPGDGWLDVVSASVDQRRALVQSIEKCLSESRRGPILPAVKVRKLRLAVGQCELRLDDKVVLRSEDFARWTKHKRVKIEIGVQPKAVEFILPGPSLDEEK